VRRPPRASVLGLVVVSVLAACGGSEPDRPAAPPPPPEIGVRMEEYRYQPSQTVVPAGRMVFRLANQGEQFHQPLLAILPEDMPPLVEQLKGSERRSIGSLVNNPGMAPRVTSAIAVDLEEGQRYAFICVAKTAQEEDHSRMGMVWEFRAGEASPAAPPGP